MSNDSGTKETRLLEVVTALEKLGRVARFGELQRRLTEQETSAEVQTWSAPRVRNLVVDFSSRAGGKHILFSAHYDSVRNSPGANDNASGVAVLLELCRRLRGRIAPVRVVFFDREEAWFRTPFLRLGLLGSICYVFRNDLSKVEATFNLEFCGIGDSLVIWPVQQKNRHLPAVLVAEAAAKTMRVGSKIAHVPGLLLSSDHLPFRLRGVQNSVTLSLLPSEEVPVFERFVSSLSIPGLLSGHRPAMPGVLARIHRRDDDSSGLSENSLRLTVSLLLETIRSYPM